jgi:tripartite-type tricarboxylate transporter receptor subunit TctC
MILSAAVGALGAGAASAQWAPGKPIRIITPGPGGSADFTARLVSDTLASRLGQPVIVENRPILIAADTVAKAAPDGHMLLGGGATIWLGGLFQKLPYDPVRDLTPIMIMTSSPNILVVHPSLPVKSVKDLIALARARPGELNYASGGIGSSPHLAGELLAAMANIKLVSISYKGSAPGLTAVMSGEVQLMFATSVGAITPHVKSGRLRALAVTTEKSSSLIPALPPVAATLPGYESTSYAVLFAPRNTPPAIVGRLHKEIAEIMTRPESREKYRNIELEVVASTPQALDAERSKQLTQIGKLMETQGIRPR